ncbi:hypothetical protein DN602_13325 [Raoultella ornithinolytica]|nr:hypothetical protein DN602_13325 [Raoultella ornithinolytica]
MAARVYPGHIADYAPGDAPACRLPGTRIIQGIPVILHVAGALAARVYPGHIADYAFRGYTRLPPAWHSNYSGDTRHTSGCRCVGRVVFPRQH